MYAHRVGIERDLQPSFQIVSSQPITDTRWRLELGRGLIKAQPKPDWCELNECEVVGGEPIEARRHPTTLFDPVEEPLDLVASTIEIGLKQIGSLRLLFGGMLAHARFFVASSLIQSAS
jgi:hypothetical protein